MRAMLLVATLAACHSSSDSSGPPSQSVRFGTVGLGDTCGVRETETGTPTQYDCAGSSTCGAVKQGIPHGDGTHNSYGVCVEPCADAAARCPDGYGCAAGGASCERTCMHDADCPSPYQSCSGSFCAIRVCLIDGDCGGTGTKCTDGVCAHGLPEG